MNGEYFMKKDRYINIILAALAIIIVLPILLLSFYTVPYNDDFATIWDVTQKMQNTGKGMFDSALALTIGRFENWGGFYAGSFFNYFINPYIRWGIIGHQITIFAINLVWVAALFLFIRVIMCDICKVKDWKSTLIIYIGLLLCFFDLYYYSETTYWYCTAVSYVLLAAAMLYGIALDIHYVVTGKKRYAFGGIICGLLASGSSLNLVALNCGLALLVVIYSIAIKKWHRSLVYFTASLLSGLLNASAPGNFVRSGGDFNIYRVMDTLFFSFTQFVFRILRLMKHSPFLLILIIMFFCMLFFKKSEDSGIRWGHLVFLAILVLIGGTVVNFPVILGYGKEYFPDRCLYVEDYVIYLGAFAFIYWMAEVCKRNHIDSKMKFNILLPVMMLLCVIVGWHNMGSNIKHCLTLQSIREIADGTAADYYVYWNSVLEEIKNADSATVLVEREEKNRNSLILQDITLTEDSDDWVNRAVASCYKKKTVILKIKDKENL